MQAGVLAELAPLPDDVICDIGFGTGWQLLRIARFVGPEGMAIGVDPSGTMIEETRDRARRERVTVELFARDGRDIGLPAGHCDAVQIEEVVQDLGDLPALLGEVKRVKRPGGRLVVADTDQGRW